MAEAKLPRVCPECGGDRHLHRYAQRELEAAQRHRRTAENIAKENGLLRYQLSIAQGEVHDTKSHLQRKIVRQARAIKRLEAKLRERGQKPYEGADLHETAPGAEYEAEPPSFEPTRPLIVP